MNSASEPDKSRLVTAELEALTTSWRRSLRARNLAPKTIKTYGEAAGQLADFLDRAGVEALSVIERGHVEDFVADQIETRSASTVERAVPGAAAVLRVVPR